MADFEHIKYTTETKYDDGTKSEDTMYAVPLIIATSITSSSTNDDIPSAKAVYDIIGDVESILASIDSGNGGAQ